MLERFDETGAAPPALAPRAAVAYFRNLLPTLGADPGRFGRLHERKAFTLAAATEKTLLERVQELIRRALETGEVIGAPAAIEALLDAAGVTPRNPQYAALVFRTNAMDSFTSGTTRELADPAVARQFPVWLYSNPTDNRTGADHLPHAGKYFPAGVPFAAVRNWYVVRGGEVVHDESGQGRPFNCRCVPIPVYKRRWAALQAAGAKVADWPPSDWLPAAAA